VIETVIVGPGMSLLAGFNFHAPFQSGERPRQAVAAARTSPIEMQRRKAPARGLDALRTLFAVNGNTRAAVYAAREERMGYQF
jgi:hypothetical protein